METSNSQFQDSVVASPSSLDSITQNSPWTKKSKRIYGACMTGIARACTLKKTTFFLTLTSAPKSPSNRINRNWQSLVQRVRRELNFKFEYLKVETSEGNGVIHALFHSAFSEGLTVETSTETDVNHNPINFKPASHTYEAIHAYFSTLWQELHKAPIVWCSVVQTAKKTAGYMTQYISTQGGYLRKSASLNWIFQGWRKKMLDNIRLFGFQIGINRWKSIIANPEFNPYYQSTQSEFVILTKENESRFKNMSYWKNGKIEYTQQRDERFSYHSEKKNQPERKTCYGECQHFDKKTCCAPVWGDLHRRSELLQYCEGFVPIARAE